ncbi:uncharacterized protein LOC114541103 isoform X2 [Dendronephthya gigantea]|uniref:uncharacterized protein LOC114541103 isoform X2 n=1 Tax=Dendronephthya gigantea TaxID=151771 RepID=UPI00106B9BF6|nr:uncharacterized protein LOC114541103 isoform X2 [Dendronephthya gigantea]
MLDCRELFHSVFSCNFMLCTMQHYGIHYLRRDSRNKTFHNSYKRLKVICGTMLKTNHSWIILLVYCTVQMLFKDAETFFLRNSRTGKCISTGRFIYSKNYGTPYLTVMIDDCLNGKAQFRYLDSDLLQNINTRGTFVSSTDKEYRNRLAVFKAKASAALRFQNSLEHRLKQTDAGSLYFYNMKDKVCAQPSSLSFYVERKTYCDTPEQKFTFGSVIPYNSKMKDVYCSPKQRMVIKKADYGNFDKNGVFDGNANIDRKCSILTNCKVKSLCGGNRSCELTVDSSLFTSEYCPDTSKEIYIKFLCQDTYKGLKGPNIRLSEKPFKGFIEIKDGSSWRKVDHENWDAHSQEAFCQYLGFKGSNNSAKDTRNVGVGENIATGDFLCHDQKPNQITCCIHLEPATTTANVALPYASCKMCQNSVVENITSYVNGIGSDNYSEIRFAGDGWCPRRSGEKYILLDLQKDYHITRVVVMGNKDQTKWGRSYTLKYSHNKTLINASHGIKVNGNQNGYQASITSIDIYNARYVSIEPIIKTTADFCLRVELCGDVQSPASVEKIVVKTSTLSVELSWKVTRPRISSYLTHFIIYLNGTRMQRISREQYGTRYIVRGLRPFTDYIVGIQAQDSSFQTSGIAFERFKTKQAVPDGPPLKVAFTSRGKDFLNVSWKPPEKSFRNGELTGYQICYSTMKNDKNPECSLTAAFSYTITTLESFTKYYVTVSAGTKVGYGKKSVEISEITDGGPPLDVVVKSRGKRSLEVSWEAPNGPNNELIGYQICFRTKETSSECSELKSTKVLSITIIDLQPAAMYFVTVSAGTEAGYGEKSLEVSKITNGAVNPLSASYYSLSINIPEPADYIKEVIVIIQRAASSVTSSESIETNDIKSYQRDTKDPYVTAYLKRDVLPLSFLIGDGKEHNSETEKYFNNPLNPDSNYIVFLRFFESKKSYYSTEWSYAVKTMEKPTEECKLRSQYSKQTTEENTRIDLLIPLVIFVCLFLLLSLGVLVYRHRQIQNKKYNKNNNNDNKNKNDTRMCFRLQPSTPSSGIEDSPASKVASKDCYDAVYERPDEVLELINSSGSEFHPEIPVEQTPQICVLPDSESPNTFYESLKLPSTSGYSPLESDSGNNMK